MPTIGEPVVLVPGLWMIGMEFGVLRHRLQADHGFDAHVFAYPTMHGDASQIAADLAEFARRRIGGSGQVHLVGHSLGGAIVYRSGSTTLSAIVYSGGALGSPSLVASGGSDTLYYLRVGFDPSESSQGVSVWQRAALSGPEVWASRVGL